MTRHTPAHHGAGTACLLGLVLLTVLVAPTGVTAAVVVGGAGQVATEPPTEPDPVGNVTDDTDDTVSTAVDDSSDAVAETIDDTSGVGSVTGTVEDTVDTLENETTNVTGSIETEVVDTPGPSGALAGTATAAVDGDGANGSAASSGSDDATGGSGASTGGTAGKPEPPDSGPTPSRGGGLPATASGVIAIGAAGAASASLLQRSAVVDSWRWFTLGRPWWSSVGLTGWLRWLAGLLGYSRYDDSNPLDHDAREALHRRIEGAPGLYLSALADEAGLPLSTARHHLRVLESEGLIEAAKIRGKRCYFPPSTEHRSLEAAMANEAQASVLATLAEFEGATVSDVAAALDVDPSTATDQLQGLAAAGLVERERDGRAVRNRLASHVEPVFDRTPAD